MNLLVVVIAFSVILQVIAAFLAIRLIRLSGSLVAWILLSTAFLVQGIRRLFVFLEYVNGTAATDLVSEGLGLIISLLVVCGVWLIRPCFIRFRQIQQSLIEKQEELARKHQALADSELRYRTVADFTCDWEFWVTPDQTLRYTSPSCQEITGYSAEEFYRDPELMTRIIHPEDQARYREHTDVLQEDGQPSPIDFRIITRSGETRWISHACRRVVDSDGASVGHRAGNRDITRRKHVEQELREYSVKLEREITERERAQEALAAKKGELESLNRTLEERVKDAVAEMRDKDQLMISQSRHAAMGEMISYIAHQWRHPLNNLSLIIQGLRHDFDSGLLSGEQMALYMNKVLELIRFMSQTIDDFRDFFRTDKASIPFSVRESVAKALRLVEASLKDNRIKVVLEPGEDLRIVGHPNEFAQALLNLLGNARDVLLERKVVEPLIQVRICSEGERCVVAVADNGGGISGDIIDKVFDPYFTTKEEGKGTGIGLFMAKTIIEKSMGGRLSVRNIEGGAEFRVEL